MSVTLILTGDSAADTTAAGSDLVHAITGATPSERPITDDDARRMDPATMIGLAALVLATPGAVLAVLDITDRLRKRRELVEKVDATKRVLERTNSEGTLTLSEVTISLSGTPTDEIVDKILDQMKG